MIRSTRLRLAGYVACMREKRNAYKDLIMKPDGRRPLEKHNTDEI
jgi:hypothetical protein